MVSCQAINLHFRAAGPESEVVVGVALPALPVHISVGSPAEKKRINVIHEHLAPRGQRSNFYFLCWSSLHGIVIVIVIQLSMSFNSYLYSSFLDIM